MPSDIILIEAERVLLFQVLQAIAPATLAGVEHIYSMYYFAL